MAICPLTFQCSSASRKFLNSLTCWLTSGTVGVSVLFSEPKIPQCRARATRGPPTRVSVLFSEPKIPQSAVASGLIFSVSCFSALQRAENSSIMRIRIESPFPIQAFQCSSASRKFLNQQERRIGGDAERVSVLFSEPKIPQYRKPLGLATRALKFQCSSASRKFLNSTNTS